MFLLFPGLRLFIAVYLALFVIAGVILFGYGPSLLQPRLNATDVITTLHQRDDEDGEDGYYRRWHRDLLDANSTAGIGEGLRWPYGDDRSFFNCSSLQDVKDLEFVASGWTKAVYRGRVQGRLVAIKTVNLNGHDMRQCLETGGSSPQTCYRKGAAKILKELILLTELAHDNIVKVLGYCVPDAVGPITIATELGDPLDTVRLLQLSWEERLRLALGIAQILHHLAHSPLGSLSMNDFRRQQFVLVNGILKLSDVDDLGLTEPECDVDETCLLDHANTSVRCIAARCYGHNERLNIWHAGQHFIRLFLPLSAPASLEPRIQELLLAYEGQARDWDTSRILDTTLRLVQQFTSGAYLDPGGASLVAGFEELEDKDLPGQFDYRCQHSTSAAVCIVSVFDRAEAARICSEDSQCSAVVLGHQHTWTGRTLAVFKNGFAAPTPRKGYRLLLKRPC